MVTTALWHQDLAWPSFSQGAVPSSSVWIPEQEVRLDTLVHLLWTPPYSEANGWDSQPSEIPLSDIVTGFLKPVGEATASGPTRSVGRRVKCDVQIDSRVPLLDFLNCHLRDAVTDVESMPSKGAPVLWQNLRWSGHARLGNFLYVAAVSGEAELELIARRDSEGVVIHFEHYLLDGWSECALGSWKLENSMLQVFDSQLECSEELFDLARPNLDPPG